MHFRQIILILALSLFNLTFTNAIEGRTTANVNLRNGPGTNFKSQLIIKKGEGIKIIELDDEWCKAKYKEEIGYISRKYVKILRQKPCIISNLTFDKLIYYSLSIGMIIFWIVTMFNTRRPGYKALTPRGIFLYTTIFIITPLIIIFSMTLGEDEFLSLQIVQLSISVLNIIDLIAIVGLWVKAIKSMNPFVIIIAALVTSLIVTDDMFNRTGQFIFSILVFSMAFDQLLLDSIEPGMKPMDKYFTHNYD